MQQQPALSAAAAGAAGLTPAKIISMLTLLSALLTGGLINNVPSSALLNMTSLFDNCTLFSREHASNGNNNSDFTWQLALPILLPLLFIVIKDWNLMLDQDKIVSIIQHFTAQITSFLSTEVIRHFIVAPDGNFTARCNLTEQECREQPGSVNTSALCPHTNYSDKQIFDSLHSIPSLSAFLFGSALVFVFFNLNSARKLVGPLFKVHPACEKYKFCSRQLLKFASVGLLLAAIYFSPVAKFKDE